MIVTAVKEPIDEVTVEPPGAVPTKFPLVPNRVVIFVATELPELFGMTTVKLVIPG